MKQQRNLQKKMRLRLMTISELLNQGTNALKSNNIENSQNEAIWILESVLSCTYSHILLNKSEDVSSEREKNFFDKINERISGVPIQYILGKWEFYGREFYVGKGVLIPRPETEILVDYALEFLKNKKSPTIIDLCAGTGCIGLTVACERPDSKVYLVEKYDEAFAYLNKNSRGIKNIELVKADVLDKSQLSVLPKADLVLSNPPYIEKSEISSLQKEVQHEPVTALDGGDDGFIFYRAIKNILPEICKGTVAMECGENQAETIGEIFKTKKFLKDFAGINRVVVCEGENK